jgi:death-on-curing family protein
VAGQRISVDEVREIAFALTRERLGFNESIPDFSTRFPNALESCLIQPFQKAYGKTLYPSLTSKAAILFYLMIKNHPFQNGNKRIAITTTLLLINNYNKWLRCDSKELYDLTQWAAGSNPQHKDFVVSAIEHFFEKRIIPFVQKD